MAIYFETLQQFRDSGGLKATTITARQLLPAVVAHMQRMDRSFTLQVNGRLPKPMDELLDEVFALCHLQQPFYTQHCASRNMRYKSVSKSRMKIDFTLRYRMTREEEKWVLDEIRRVLARIIKENMSPLEKVIAVHDYIIRAYDYEMETDGSPFTVYTFMHEKQGVCMAYALLFEKMMEQLGIPCYYVVGKADGERDLGHAWNMVELDGAWYHIDATWNDLGKRKGHHEIRYRYFLCADEVMKRDHEWNLDHYPPCVSERFEKLHALYDVAFSNGTLYFPHPKTAQLTVLDISQLVVKKEQAVRVQHCMMLGNTLYFSNYSDHGFLYSYDVETKELTKLAEQQVARITAQEMGLVVTYADGDCVEIVDDIGEAQRCEVEETLTPDVTVPLLRFGDSWFGSYEGKAAHVLFEAEDGLQLLIQEEVKQLTVDCLLHETFEIRMTSKRKAVTWNTPAVLKIPSDYLNEATQLNDSAGVPIEVARSEGKFVMSLTSSVRITY